MGLMREMRYKAAIFDLDGTLLDTSVDLNASVNYALAKNGLPTQTIAETKARTGNGIVRLVGRSVPAGAPDQLTQRVFQDFRIHYAQHNLDSTAPYPGIPELVRDLRAGGISCSVVSNKVDSAVQELTATIFPGAFDVVVGEREADGIRRKPAPDMVNACMRQLGVSCEDALYIGDSEVDLVTAANAHTDCAAVTWGFRTEEQLVADGATILIHTPSDLRKLLLGA